MATLATVPTLQALDRPGRVKPPSELKNEAYELSREIARATPGINLDTNKRDACAQHFEQLAIASYAKSFDPTSNEADRIEMERFEQAQEERKEAQIIASNANDRARQEEIKGNQENALAGEDFGPSLTIAFFLHAALTLLFSVALHDAFIMFPAEWRWAMAVIAGAIISGVPVSIMLNKTALKSGWSYVGMIAGVILVAGQFIFRYYYAESNLSPALAPAVMELAVLLFMEIYAWKLHKKYLERDPHAVAAEEAGLNKASSLARAAAHETKIRETDAYMFDFVQYVRNREWWAQNHVSIVAAIRQAAELGFLVGHDEKLNSI